MRRSPSPPASRWRASRAASPSRSCRQWDLRAGLPLAFIGVILAANRATRIFANPIVGHLADRIGGRRTLLVGMLLQFVVMALYWLGVRTDNPGVFFLVGRIVHGPASSCVFVSGPGARPRGRRKSARRPGGRRRARGHGDRRSHRARGRAAWCPRRGAISTRSRWPQGGWSWRPSSPTRSCPTCAWPCAAR